MSLRSHRLRLPMALSVALAMGVASAPAQDEPADRPAGRDPAAQDLPEPKPIPPFELDALPTIPVRRGPAGPTWVQVDTDALPRDREGIWILEFAFKPVRVIEIETPGKGRRRVLYMYYRVINRTGEPRRFVPQFTLVTDTGQKLEDTVLPLAVQKIQAKEDPSKRLLGGVEVMGSLPPSTKEGIDDALYGVAIWDGVDYEADAFSVYVRGLSDGNQVVEAAAGQDPLVRHKAIRVDFARPGDERRPGSREIYLKQPPFEWIYYPEADEAAGQ